MLIGETLLTDVQSRHCWIDCGAASERISARYHSSRCAPEISFHISGEPSGGEVRLEQVPAQTMRVSHEKDAGTTGWFSRRIDRLFRIVQHVVRLEKPV